MRLRRALALVMLLCTLLALSGCWDRTELEENSFVLGIGVDKGKESLYAVTFMIALPDKMAGGGPKGGGGDGDEKPYLLTTVEAPSIAGAIAMVDNYTSRQVSLLHVKSLFMGEELARDSGLHTMDEFVRFREARRSVFYIVTRGRAGDFLKQMEPKMEKDPQRFIEAMTYQFRHTGMLPGESQIQHFVSTVNTGYEDALTYYAALKEETEEKAGKESSQAESQFKAGETPRTGGPNVEVLGGAAFRGDRMVGTLAGDEVRLVLLLQDKFQRTYLSIPDPKNPKQFVSLNVYRGRPMAISVDVRGTRSVIRATVTLEGEILAMAAGNDYTEPELQPVLEREVVGELEQGFRALIDKTQGWGTDVPGFGRHVVKHFPTVQAWHAYDWPNRYSDADIKVDVRFTLRRFGIQLSPPEPEK